MSGRDGVVEGKIERWTERVVISLRRGVRLRRLYKRQSYWNYS